MNRRCVHVVDDEDAVRRSTQMILRVLGYETQAFGSGFASWRHSPGLLTAVSCSTCECPKSTVSKFSKG